MIELLVVMCIVGILAAVVAPAYLNGAQKSRRAEGRNVLTEMATLQEKYYSQNNRFTINVTAAGSGLGMGEATSLNGYYALGASAGSCGTIASCYVLSAKAIGAQAEDSTCYMLTLDDAGRKKAYTLNGDDSSDECW